MNVSRLHLHAGLGIAMVALVSGTPGEVEDWRLDLLELRGFSPETERLEAWMARQTDATSRLDDVLAKLGSDDFETREQAQAEIRMAGEAALAWIEGLPRQEDPEIRFRLRQTSEQLRNRGLGLQEELLGFAVRSLLADRKAGSKPAAPAKVFAEWFERKADPVDGHYGPFTLQVDPGMTAKVSGGSLQFPGARQGDGDQALILTSAALGLERFPGKFRVSCLMAGENRKGAGAWHAGVSVGQVRILYHPGMRGGAFRLETTDGKKPLCPNESMGFDPATETMQRIDITVTQERSGDVLLDVRIASLDGKNVFRKKTMTDAGVIGALDRVGLWRSGRTGATALFDDFVLDLRDQ